MKKTSEALIGRVVDQLRDILSEGEYDTGEIAAAAKKAADMMRRGEVEVDWLAVHMERREAFSDSIDVEKYTVVRDAAGGRFLARKTL